MTRAILLSWARARRLHTLAWLGLILVVSACTATRTPASRDPAGAALPTGSPGWRQVLPGVERRDLRHADRGWTMALVRADPAQVTFRVHYRRGAALALRDWAAALPEAQVIINGAFFDERDHALGLIVSDGQVFGNSFVGFGGMLQIDTGGVRVRALAAEPYQGEALEQALQAFPMLIVDGQPVVLQGGGFDEVARRSWVGQDRAGRIVVGVVPSFIALADLQAWLLASDLDLWAAFALDGGRSSGMIVRRPGQADEVFAAFDQLPSVLAIYAP